MKRGWVALVAAMLLTSGFAQAADREELIGTDFAAEVVALEGDTLLIIGPASGDPLPLPQSIESGRTRILLWGIAAPEMSGRDGWAARAVLDALLSQGPTVQAGDFSAVTTTAVTCTVVDLHYKGKGPAASLVARCGNRTTYGTGEKDLGEALVREGFATPYRSSTYANPTAPELLALARLYDKRESYARQERRGLWSLRP